MTSAHVGGRATVLLLDLRVDLNVPFTEAVAFVGSDTVATVTIEWVFERGGLARAIFTLALAHRHRPGLLGYLAGDAALRAEEPNQRQNGTATGRGGCGGRDNDDLFQKHKRT